MIFFKKCDIIILENKKGENSMKAQVTLIDKTGKYRPVSTLVPIDSADDLTTRKEEIKYKGIKKICITRGWIQRDLLKYHYLHCKMRIYPEKKA